MKSYTLVRSGVINNASCEYKIEADSPEEALEKFHKGDVYYTEIIEGDFEDDDDEVTIEDFEEES